MASLSKVLSPFQLQPSSSYSPNIMELSSYRKPNLKRQKRMVQNGGEVRIPAWCLLAGGLGKSRHGSELPSSRLWNGITEHRSPGWVWGHDDTKHPQRATLYIRNTLTRASVKPLLSVLAGDGGSELRRKKESRWGCGSLGWGLFLERRPGYSHDAPEDDELGSWGGPQFPRWLLPSWAM